MSIIPLNTHLSNDIPSALQAKVLRPIELILNGSIQPPISSYFAKGAGIVISQTQYDRSLQITRHVRKIHSKQRNRPMLTTIYPSKPTSGHWLRKNASRGGVRMHHWSHRAITHPCLEPLVGSIMCGFYLTFVDHKDPLQRDPTNAFPTHYNAAELRPKAAWRVNAVQVNLELLFLRRIGLIARCCSCSCFQPLKSCVALLISYPIYTYHYCKPMSKLIDILKLTQGLVDDTRQVTGSDMAELPRVSGRKEAYILGMEAFGAGIYVNTVWKAIHGSVQSLSRLALQ